MEPKALPLSIFGALTIANLAVSGVTMAMGVFVAASPRRAAEIWGSERLHGMSAAHQALVVRWFRIFGIFLFLTGACFAIHYTFLED